MVTFNNILSLFKIIADAHPGINSFGWGEKWQQNETQSDLYPRMWLEPLESVVQDHTQERTFNLYIYDLVSKDKRNNQDVLSDTEQIINDIVVNLRQDPTFYEVIGDPQFFQFTEELGDWVSGWSGNIVIQTDLNTNRCAIPIGDYYGPNTPTDGGVMPTAPFKCSDIYDCTAYIDLQTALQELNDEVNDIQTTLAIPADQIVYGTGSSITSSPSFITNFGINTRETRLFSPDASNHVSTYIDNADAVIQAVGGNFRIVGDNLQVLGGGTEIRIGTPTTGNINLVTSTVSRIFIDGANGETTISHLSGSGTRMVVASSTGVLSAQSIPDPSLTATYVGFGSVSNLLTGSSDFTWDGSLLSIVGNAQISDLSGSGNRMVVADASGVLSTQAIPSSASLTATYVGYGSGANALTGSSLLTWDNAATTLNVNGVAASTASTIFLTVPGQGGTLSFSAFNEGVINSNSLNLVSINNMSLLVGSGKEFAYYRAGVQFASMNASGDFTYNHLLSANAKFDVRRSDVGGSIYAENNSYNLGGASPVVVKDGLGNTLGIGYGSNVSGFVSALGGGIFIQGYGQYGTYLPQVAGQPNAGLNVAGKMRIGDGAYNTGHQLEVVGDVQVTSQAGTGDRMVEADSDGVQSATKEIVGQWITDLTAIALLTDTSNWSVIGVFSSSPGLMNTYQTQMYADDNYFYIMKEDNLPIRTPRV